MDKTAINKPKNGMYGELPKVNIGRFSICQMTDKEGETDIWIQDEETGEGSQIKGSKIEIDIQNIFDKYL